MLSLLQREHAAYNTPHHEIGYQLNRLVIGPVVQYLPSASPFLQHVHLAADQIDTCGDPTWQQVQFEVCYPRKVVKGLSDYLFCHAQALCWALYVDSQGLVQKDDRYTSSALSSDEP
jgi:hypothetical protein